jgi:truncated hemoglobin YjbI
LSKLNYPIYQSERGYLTETTQQKFITKAVASKLLPKDAHRIPEILSLKAPNDMKKPIQFWQLYSVLGQDPIVGIVSDFYRRVFADEKWFRTPFARVGDLNHHIGAQASMWLDVMGGGPYYHGAEYRLNFHPTHNAHMLLDEKGARRWAKLMILALESSQHLMTDDPRVRLSINTFLAHFFAKYASDFKFKNCENFGESNPPFRHKTNFMNMTEKSIEALSEEELHDALIARGVYLGGKLSKADLVQKALNL